MRKRVYIETTVVSYFTSKPSRDLVVAAHQQSTCELWSQLIDEYETFVSALVLEESGKGDAGKAQMRLDAIKSFRMLDIDDSAQTLAEQIIKNGGIPKEYPEDALHVAVAAVNGMEVLLTWNFAHLNNPFTRRRIRDVIEHKGYHCPEICSPDELLEVEK